jgi:hypothetical protein
VEPPAGMWFRLERVADTVSVYPCRTGALHDPPALLGQQEVTVKVEAERSPLQAT